MRKKYVWTFNAKPYLLLSRNYICLSIITLYRYNMRRWLNCTMCHALNIQEHKCANKLKGNIATYVRSKYTTLRSLRVPPPSLERRIQWGRG